MEKAGIEGNTPVDEMANTSDLYPKYHGAREIPCESGGTTRQA